MEVVMRESEDLGEEESRRMTGKEKEESLGIRVRVVKARTGLESVICLEISPGVLRGLVVVRMAPRERTAREAMGK